MSRQTTMKQVTVTCSHSAKTVEFRYGFKLLWLALHLTFFSCRYRENPTAPVLY